jgi:hypothetical protein
MFAEVSTFFALAAEFRKVQLERGETATADEFRRWLEHAVIPQMREQADQVLASVISLKASQHEQLREILDRLAEIGRAVIPATASSTWADLQDDDRRVLEAVFHDALKEGSRGLDSRQLHIEGMPVDRVRRSARFLHEQRWGRYTEGTQAWFFFIAPPGLLFVWEATAPGEYRDGIARIAKHLPSRGQSQRIGTIAELAGVPFPLAYAVLVRWAKEGAFTLSDGYSPPTMNLVHSVSETFAREMGLQAGDA